MIRTVLKLKSTPTEAKSYALKLLSYRSRSEKEMRERLKKKGFSNEQIRDTIKFLSHTGLINDRLLATDLMTYSVRRKSLGRMGIRMFLTKRGIDSELIESALADHTEEKEMASALELMDRKLRVLEKYPQKTVKRRLLGMLRRRGFSGSVIHRALNTLKH
jgi:regulatory protein